MIIWSHSAYLLLLTLLIPLFWMGYKHGQWQQNAAMRLANLQWQQKMSDQRHRYNRRNISWLVAIALGIVALAGPRWGQTIRQVETRNLQMMIVLDVSQSMLAEDVPENRLRRAKTIIREATALLEPEDQVGLIAFAGETRLLLPLTSLKSELNRIVFPLDPDDFIVQGTVLGPALATAVQSFSYPRAGQPVILLLSDGEEFGGDVLTLARQAASNDVLLFTIGLGTEAGTHIPRKNAATGEVSLQLDATGQPVLSQLDVAFLQQLALVGNGRYLSGENAKTTLPDTLQTIRQTHTGTQIIVEPTQQYQIWLLLALALFSLNWIKIRVPKLPKFTAAVVGLHLLVITLIGCQTTSISKNIASGNEAFAQSQYDEAVQAYETAVTQNPEAAIPLFNLANAKYRLNQYPEAITIIQTASSSVSSNLVEDMHFNLGNSYFQIEAYEAAITAYQAALRMQPNDLDAKYNLELAIVSLQNSNKTAGSSLPQDQPIPANPESSLGSSNNEITPPFPINNDSRESLNQEEAEFIIFNSFEESIFLKISAKVPQDFTVEQRVSKSW